MRADRLVATLLLLQTRGRVTAADVATELEVSERTARRDLDALSTAGIPVYASRGRGGGWELVGGARTDLTGLTAEEARTLFLVVGPSAAASPELKTALRKLVRALPEPFRAGAEASVTSVVVDPAAWGTRGAGTRPAPPHLEALQRATVDGVEVRLSYSGRDRTLSVREVHPLGLVAKQAVWYLVAGTDDGTRPFRVDRVRGVERTGRPAVRPPGFDLDAAWRDVVATVTELRAPAKVRAAADPRLVQVLRWLFDQEIAIGDPRPDGRVDVVVSGMSLDVVARRLAGFGAAVEVLDPPEARGHLAEIGRQLAGLYG